LGLILSGGVLLIGFDWLGWARVCQWMAGAIALTTLPIAGFREPPGAVERPGLQVFAEFFRRPGVVGWLAAIAAFKVGEAFGVGMLRPFLVDAGLGFSDIGWLTGTAGFLAGLVGAMVGGAFVGSYGRYRCLFVFGAVQALAVGCYAIAAAGARDAVTLYALCTFEHFAGGMATVALFTMMMDASRPQAAGTDYTVQASVVVLATGLGAALSGFAAGAIGYTAHFLVAAGLCVLGMIPALLHHRRVRRGATAIADVL
jgi:predicted MFS family arabinose efflux permease